jgi:hypothetical protein
MNIFGKIAKGTKNFGSAGWTTVKSGKQWTDVAVVSIVTGIGAALTYLGTQISTIDFKDMTWATPLIVALITFGKNWVTKWLNAHSDDPKDKDKLDFDMIKR